MKEGRSSVKKKSIFAIGGALSAIFVIGLVVYGNSQTEDAKQVRLLPDDLQLVAMGKKIYDVNCASCHGRDFKGEANWRERRDDGLLPAPPHDETGHTWHHPDDLLFALTKYGPAKMIGDGYQSAMPGFENVLTDEEIIASLSYIKSRWPEEIRLRHDQINQSATQ
nr:cytochrome c [Thalassospira sp. A3_1]